MATAIPKLSNEQIQEIIDGVKTGWLADITVEDNTEADPFCRVVLLGHQWNTALRGLETVRIQLGAFRLKPNASHRTVRRVIGQYLALYREAKQVHRIALQSEVSPTSKRKAA